MKNYAGGISVCIYMSLVCICVSLRAKKSAASDTLRQEALGMVKNCRALQKGRQRTVEPSDLDPVFE